MDKSYEIKNFDKSNYYIERISKDINLIKANKIFFVEPNIILINIIFFYMMSYIENKFGKDLPVDFLDDFIKEMDNFREHYFTSFLDFSCIYETNNSNYDLCLFAQLMEGYSIFYHQALESIDYKRKYKNFVSYLEDVGSHLERVEKEYKEYQKKKLYKENYEANKNK